ncbi:MAG: DUF99 family protein [Nitrososphaeria archaeon]|nr:DUF99 family protein [Nitrososphaeria archaeon]NIN52746.1 DUF99 family protein [Nitrososphaeria archaeon]NIQ33223.1 DUF99 family protein [Nitrososphaeria archaeon]
MHIKKGFRMLGVAESFRKKVGKKSILAGVVMRADLIVDGFSLGFPTVGGMDATQELIGLYKLLDREDINVLCMSGSVISWYNVVDFNRAFEELGVPIISVTYEESEGLENHFKRNFPSNWEERVRIYQRNGHRTRVKMKTGFEIYTRGYGLTTDEALTILNAFTLTGRIPEPIKTAKILAHSLAKKMLKSEF